MILIKVYTISIIICLLCTVLYAAGPFYVSTSGNDTWDGSKAMPFFTLEKALSEMRPGVTVCTTYIGPGIYVQSLCITNSGTMNDPLVIMTSNNSPVIFSASSQPVGFCMSNARHVILQNISVSGFNENNIIIKNCTDITFSNVTVTNALSAAGKGIAMYESSNIAIRHCTIADNGSSTGSAGVFLSEVQSVEIAATSITESDYGVLTDGTAAVRAVIMHSNTIYGTRRGGICLIGNCSDWDIRYSYFSDISGLWSRGIWCDAGSSGYPHAITIRGCCFYSNACGIFIDNGDGIVVDKCEFINNESHAYFLADPGVDNNDDCVVRNSVFISNGNTFGFPGIYIDDGDNTALMLSGIITVGHFNGGIGLNNPTQNNQIIYDSDITDGVSGGVTCSNCINADPLFNNIMYGDTRLLSRSPCFRLYQNNGTSGAHTLTFYAVDNTINMVTAYTLVFTSGLERGSIPPDAVLSIDFPVGFNCSSAQCGAVLSSWGGGSALFTVNGFDRHCIIHRSGGSATVPGSTETLVIEGIRNPSIAGDNYFPHITVTDSTGNIIEYESGNAIMITNSVLLPAEPLRIEWTMPFNTMSNYSATNTEIMIAFNSNMSGSSVAQAAAISGAGVSGLEYVRGDGTQNIVLRCSGSLIPMYEYTITIGAASSTIHGSQLGTNYTFTFRTVPGVPSMPLDIKISNIRTNGFDIMWTDTADNEEGYAVYISTNSYIPITPLYYLASNSSVVQLRGLSDGDMYFVWIAAYNGTGRSKCAHTNQRTFYCIPSPVCLLNINNNFSNIILTWSNSAENETGLRIYRNTNNIKPIPINAIATNAADSIIYTDTSVSSNQTYWYWVETFNPGGAAPAISARISLCPGLPRTPESCILLPGDDPSSDITVAWVDRSTNEIGFYITLMSNGGQSLCAVYTNPPNSVQCSISNLVPMTEYTIWVESYNTTGSSGAIQATIATLPAIPDAPKFISIGSITHNSIAVHWTDIAGETSYCIYYSTISQQPSMPTVQLPSNSVDYILRGLHCNTTYYIWISSSNSSGCSHAAVLPHNTRFCRNNEVFNTDALCCCAQDTLFHTSIMPNPIEYFSDTDNTCTFFNLTSTVNISIYNSLGEKVIALHKNDSGGCLKWDMHNTVYESIDAGIYYARIEDPLSGEYKIIQFAVIR